MSEKTIIVGPNASGKSNMLDAIRFLRDLAKQGGGLQQAVKVRGGVSMIRSQAARRNPRVKVAVEVSEGERKTWRYELEFTQEGGGVRQLAAVIKSELLTHYGSTPHNSETFQAGNSEQRLDQFTLIERPDMNQKFIEFTDFLRDIQYLHLVPQLVRDPRSFISVDNTEDYFGRDFIAHISSGNKAQSSAFLNRISEFLRIAVPGFQEMHVQKDEKGEPHLAVKFRTWRMSGVNQDESHLSDGTLRLIGLLWALQYGTKPVLLEEPELSLHPEIVRRLYEVISRLQTNSKRTRQVILTTHSPDLLANQAIQSREVVLLETKEGFTDATTINKQNDLKQLLDNGFNVAEVVLPRAAPKNMKDIDQLSLFK